MKENFPNLLKEVDIQVQEVQRVPTRWTKKKTRTRNIIKMTKVKERILKAARKKADSYPQKSSHKTVS